MFGVGESKNRLERFGFFFVNLDVNFSSKLLKKYPKVGIFFCFGPLGLRNKNLKYMKNTKTQKRRFLNGSSYRALSCFRPYFCDLELSEGPYWRIAIPPLQILADT